MWNGSNDLVTRFMKSLDLDTFLAGAGRTEGAFRYFRWLLDNARIDSILLGGYGWNYEGGAYEMTYICVFVLGGLIGVTIFLYPFFLIGSKSRRNFAFGNYIMAGIAEGLIVYAVSAFIEGAYWLPPTALNVWVMLSMARLMNQYKSPSRAGEAPRCRSR